MVLRSGKDGAEIYLTRRRFCAVWTAWKSRILSLQTNSNRRFTELNSFLLAANLNIGGNIEMQLTWED